MALPCVEADAALMARLVDYLEWRGWHPADQAEFLGYFGDGQQAMGEIVENNPARISRQKAFEFLSARFSVPPIHLLTRDP